MYKSLQEYIKRLESTGELMRISAKVNTELEIAEITERQAKSEGGGKALLFENTDSGIPVLTNMLGSDNRICAALGVDTLEQLYNRINDIFDKVSAPRSSIYEKLAMLPTLKEMSEWAPRRRAVNGECREVIYTGKDARLSMLPILKCAPHDGGAFVTLPLVHTVDPETGSRNVGMYRMQVFDDYTTGMHWHRHKTGERHYNKYKELEQRMPVVVCLGGDPAYTYSATAPLPDNIDEYLLAGFIRRKPVELTRCVSCDMYVPRDCDIVIEGYVDPSEEKVIEGPFGDHTGFYSLEDYYPKFHVTAITMRRDAVYPATIVGIPPEEDAYIAKATEAIFLAPIQMVMQPEVNDMYLPSQGTAHNIAIVDIDKRYPGQAMKVAGALWGAGQMMFNKFMLITSSCAGRLRTPSAIKEMLSQIVVSRDVMFSRGPLDVLDHAASAVGFGGKMCIDATVKTREEAMGDLPAAAVVKTPVLTQFVCDVDLDPLRNGWRTIILKIDREADFKRCPRLFFEENGTMEAAFVILVDKWINTTDIDELLWIASSNADFNRDVYIYERKTLVIDARMKAGSLNGFSRRWPNVVTSDDATIKLVDSRMSEYGFKEFIPSPSLKYKHLVLSDDAAIE